MATNKITDGNDLLEGIEKKIVLSGTKKEYKEKRYYFIPISAKTENTLNQKYKDLINWLKKDNNKNSLGDIAYTLLIGRSHFSIRNFFIVRDLQELTDSINNIITNNILSGKKVISKFDSLLLEEGNNLIDELKDSSIKNDGVYLSRLEKLGKMYVEGYDLDWEKLYYGEDWYKISMPTYPFELNHYWVEEWKDHKSFEDKVQVLHPIIDSNNSTLQGQSFIKTFNGNEFYLKDHVVGKSMILPGVVYLEMARAAGSLSNKEGKVLALKDITWESPIKLDLNDKEKKVDINIFTVENNVEFEVSNENADGTIVVYSSGRILYEDNYSLSENNIVANIDKIKKVCTKKVNGKECYKGFSDRGLYLGKTFQSLKEINYNENEIIALLELPENLNNDFDEYIIHPALMDGALEAVIAFILNDDKNSKVLALPFEMKSIEIYRPMQKRMYSHIVKIHNNKKDGSSYYNVDILDDKGNLIIAVRGFGLRPFFQFEKPIKKDSSEKLYYYPDWIEKGLYEEDFKVDSNLMVFIKDESDIEKVKQKFKNEENKKIITVIPGEKYKQINEYLYKINIENIEDYKNLFQVIKAKGCFPLNVIHYLEKDSDNIDECLKYGYYTSFNITKSILECDLKDKLKYMYLYSCKENEISPLKLAISSFIRTVRIENPKLIFKTLGIYENSNLIDIALKEFDNKYDKDIEVIFKDKKRQIRKYKEFEFKDPSYKSSTFKRGGVYLITGGAGSLGLIFAKYIIENAKDSKVVLCGRSDLNSEKNKYIQQYPNRIFYVKTDVENKESVRNLKNKIKQQLGNINGIIHSAGSIRDSYIINKTHKEIKTVLGPKIQGTLNLDEVFKDEELDFIILFSSIAALTGNMGQCDYSYANSFMDYFIEYRDKLVNEGKRKGKSLSINWSLWKDGGMQVDESVSSFFSSTIGIKPIENETGINGLINGLESEHRQILIVEGNKENLEDILNRDLIKENTSVELNIEEEKVLEEKTRKVLIKIVGNILKISEKYIDFDKDMNEFGFNSLSFTDFSNDINACFKINTNPALFFEHSTLNSFVGYLVSEYSAELTKHYSEENSEVSKRKEVYEEKKNTVKIESKKKSRFKSSNNFNRLDEDIAVIGMSGVMPLSENLNEFWDNIVSGKDLVTEVPKERWDWEQVNKEEGMEISKWGGFMKEIDKFDALFFGISPREATLMDPQQRIFLQTVWSTMEDSGYRPSDISGKKVGLFVGVTTMDYADVERDSNIKIEAYSTTGASHCILANRVSYLLNLHGPSVPIDTACSSSLIAIHQAVESIKNGDSEMAIAGGVSALLSSTVFVSFTKAGMLSPDGRCKTFDNNANGYVRGEGCGAVLLKPLSKAIRDGDNIHAIIKSSSVNHGGKSNSLTAPNAKAQTQLLINAYEKANFRPDTISYIEAHGTGTNLGDPVEINSLKSAFKELYKRNGMVQEKEQYCGLASVKTNIGHLEAAAGIAGVLKVILAMKNKKIPTNINLNKVNKYINLEGSPFYIVKDTMDWKCMENENGEKIPRRAGVSAFGFGGANAHIVLEEYCRQKDFKTQDELAIIVLSANNKNSLRLSAINMMNHIKQNIDNEEDVSLRDIAYTLQVGREEMEYRLAFVINSSDEMILKLSKYINRDESSEDIFSGSLENKDNLLFDSVEDEKEYIEKLFEKKKYRKIAQLWSTGVKIDWTLLYPIEKPYRMALPTYPFEKIRYWVSPEGKKESAIKGKLNRVIDSNESTLIDEKFKKVLTIDEFYIKDHVVSGKTILPGVVYLEIARAAGEIAGEKVVRGLEDVIWIKPIEVGNDGKEIYVRIYIEDNVTKYEIYSIQGDNQEIHSTGNILFDQKETVIRKFDIQEIKDRCIERKYKDECYQNIFKKVGFDYGESFQVTEESFIGKGEGLAKLNLPNCVNSTLNEFVLHPSLMDGVLRAITWIKSDNSDTSLRVPFSVGSLEILGEIPNTCYSYATLADHVENSGITNYNICILDENGSEVVRINKFSVREYKNIESQISDNAGEKFSYYVPYWKEYKSAGNRKINKNLKGNNIIVFQSQYNHDKIKDVLQTFEDEYDNVINVISGSKFEKINECFYYINIEQDNHYKEVIEHLNEDKIEFSNIVYLWDDYDNSKNIYSDSNNVEEVYSSLKHDEYRGVYSILNVFKILGRAEANKNIRCVFTIKVNEFTRPQVESIYGFVRTINMINSKFEIEILEVSDNIDERTIEVINKELTGDTVLSGRYLRLSNAKIFIRQLKSHNINVNNRDVLRQNGVYLITGGTGALGMIFARYLAEKYSAKLILIGRQKLNEKIQAQLNELQNLGATAIYEQADVGNIYEVKKVIEVAKGEFKVINGIFNCAGLADSNNINQSSTESFEKVFIPKIKGTINLDFATINESLDVFVMFSSITAETGDLSSGSYAIANSFMDKYSKMRNDLLSQNKRTGKTISINWPFWIDGGFEFPKELLQYYTRLAGINEINKEIGLKAFEELIKTDLPQAVVIYGNSEKAIKSLNNIDEENNVIEDNQITNNEKISSNDDFNASAEEYLKIIFSQATKIPINKISKYIEFNKFGVDSILIMELNNVLEKKFGQLPKTLFFEYNNIISLAKYLVENYKEHFLKDVTSKPSSSKVMDKKEVAVEINKPVTKEAKTSRFLVEKQQVIQNEEKTQLGDDIAIVGIYGRYPSAEDLEEFWENISQGKDCITEIPKDRWEYDEETDKYSNAGGFIKDVDKFDAKFFNMTEREAVGSDPQERVFLETVEHAVEDAGYTRKDLSQGITGVYVGVMYGQYNLFGVEESVRGNKVALSSLHAAIPNRVSYHYDLKGPSMAIETMCSSSLTAVHLACNAIRNKEIDMAIAGGINLTIHPDKHNFLLGAGFIASDGKCRSYGEGGDGYVPGEGSGALILKPLSKAMKDKDNIYAVIKATAVNHNGKTNAYSVPSPKAQEEMMKQAFKEARVDPKTISYIEGHGTGTPLGDAIEIVGLSKIFNGNNIENKKYPLGSVKSNIGHLESAAGIAAISKVLLQLKNKKIAPSINSDVLNKNIDFENLPFHVQHELSEWRKISMNDNGKEDIPRRATISCLGAGGSNAFMIIEEYEKNNLPIPSIEDKKNVFVISTQSKERLEIYANKFYEYVKKQSLNKDDNSMQLDLLKARVEESLIEITANILNVNVDDINIHESFTEYSMDWMATSNLVEKINNKYNLELLSNSIYVKNIDGFVKYLVNNHEGKLYDYYDVDSNKNEKLNEEKLMFQSMLYTLQLGREAFDERLAIVTSNMKELEEKLKYYCNGEKGIDGIYTANIAENDYITETTDKDKNDIKNLFNNKDMNAIAKKWIEGFEVDWTLLHYDDNISKISLPVYPLERKLFWAIENEIKRTLLKKEVKNVINELIDTNESTFDKQCFKKKFDKEKMNLKYSSLNGVDYLSNMIFLEMARLVGNLSYSNKNVVLIKDIKWSKNSAFIKPDCDIKVDLYATNNSSSNYSIALIEEKEFIKTSKVLTKGSIVCSESYLTSESFDLKSVKGSCNKEVNIDDYYTKIKESGREYHNEFKKINNVFHNKEEMLISIDLSTVSDKKSSVNKNAILFECLAQGVLYYKHALEGYKGIYSPYSIKEINILGEIQNYCFIHLSKVENSFDVKIIDSNMKIVMSIKEFQIKRIDPSNWV